MDLLDYYRDNLGYLRGLSGEFAAEFPKIARRLLISDVDCQDPYIERLLEGTAFLAAKVEKKLDDGYFPFLESILNSLAPDALYPIPAGAVLEVFPNLENENIKKGAVLPAGTVFDTVIPTINTPCRFSSAANMPIVPFTVTQAEYLSRDVASLGIDNPKAESALRLQFSSIINNVEKIDVFFALSEADTSLLQRLLTQDVAGVYVKSGGNYIPLEKTYFSIPLPSAGELYDRTVKTGVHGLRILRNYLNYPDFFKFVSINIPECDLAKTSTGTELAVAFKRKEQPLSAVIKAPAVKANCVPALNLFSKRSNRINLEKDEASNPYEFHMIPDRTAMRDYEIVSVINIEFYNEQNEMIAAASNFYDENKRGDKKNHSFFSIKRRRKPVERRSAARSTYDGCEVFVSFSPVAKDAWQFAADLLVTNRDLPLLVADTAVLLSTSALAPQARFISMPTRPGYPLSEHGDRGDFARLSHIVMNLSAMLCQEGRRPLELLRNILRYYPLRPPEEMDRMISGIHSLSGKSDTFRFIKNGVVFYEWGWRVSMSLDEDAYAGAGFYIFANVIAQLLLSFTPLNTILEIEVSTLQSGVIAVWKTPEER